MDDLGEIIGHDKVLELRFSSRDGQLETELWNATFKRWDRGDEVSSKCSKSTWVPDQSRLRPRAASVNARLRLPLIEHVPVSRATPRRTAS